MPSFTTPWRIWAGAIMSPAAGTASGSFIMSAALLGGRVSPEVAAFGAAGGFYAYVVSGALSGVVMIAASVVILRTDVVSRWLGWSGVVVGTAAILGSSALVENNPAGLFAIMNAFAWLVYFLWMAAVSIELIDFARFVPPSDFGTCLTVALWVVAAVVAAANSKQLSRQPNRVRAV